MLQSFCHSLIFSTIIFILSSCSGLSNEPLNAKEIKSIIKQNISPKAELAPQTKSFIQIDLNGDNIDELVVLFIPPADIGNDANLIVKKPWPSFQDKPYSSTSLAIFTGRKDSKNQYSDTKTYILLDNSGRLETPSFELIVSDEHQSNKMLILPSEAGIDSYLQWDGEKYVIVEREEIP